MQEIPAPLVRPGHVLIANERSVISAGTERSLLQLGKKSLLGKARERPDQVRRVVEKMRTEGVFRAVEQAFAKLDELRSLGYSSAGRVLACGEGVAEFQPGDRVASNGPHAGVVCVPRHLCAKVPEGVTTDQAAFAVLASIALQGVRNADVTLGGTAFVIGLGLIGQLTVSLLRGAGCRVIGTDLEGWKCELALLQGCEIARAGMSAAEVQDLTGGWGADSVLIAASTPSNAPVELAARAVRKKGRIVAIGAVGMDLPRQPLYNSEASFVVSCSYGPGRYDPRYEERGQDYPLPHVRWTEQRNIQATLSLMARGDLQVDRLVTHRYPIGRADEAYTSLESGSEPILAVTLEYPEVFGRKAPARSVRTGAPLREGVTLACVGAGQFARLTLLPLLARQGEAARLRTLVSAGGLAATDLGERYGFEIVSTDEEEAFADDEVQAVFLVTRHGEHVRQVLRALDAGKDVFVEKPLALTLEDLSNIDEALERSDGAIQRLMVGYNRRFSPAARQVRQFFQTVEGPLAVSVRFNAGSVPAEHWTQDPDEGGGRLIGEACHAIDLATFLCGSLPVRVYAVGAPAASSAGAGDDLVFLSMRHANGSISSIAYLSSGDKAFPKERIEVFGGGQVAVIDDFKSVSMTANGRTRRRRNQPQDKGHREEIRAFLEALREGHPSPIPWNELRAVSLASILAVRSLREGVPFEIP